MLSIVRSAANPHRDRELAREQSPGPGFVFFAFAEKRFRQPPRRKMRSSDDRREQERAAVKRMRIIFDL